MRRRTWFLGKVGAMAVGVMFLCQGLMAKEEHKHRGDKKIHKNAKHGEAAPGHSQKKAAFHGGQVTMSKEFHFETVFSPGGVKLYLYDATQNPMHWKHWKKGLVKGNVTITFRDPRRKAVKVELVRKAVGKAQGEYKHGQHKEAEHKEHHAKPAQAEGKGHREHRHKMLWSCPMHPAENGTGPGKCKECNMKFVPQDHLFAKVDLKGVAPGAAKATIALSNLPGQKETKLKFRVKNKPAKKQQE